MKFTGSVWKKGFRGNAICIYISFNLEYYRISQRCENAAHPVCHYHYVVGDQPSDGARTIIIVIMITIKKDK